jgi:hydroxymethylpyrimidine/phosphomethylpyrimidine kinase
MRTALTIAGSDPSGGAGIQGDLKTFAAHGVYGMAVLTALTAQNTRGVRGIHEVPAAFVRAQLDAVFEDMPVHAVKTGMLANAETVRAVVEVLAKRQPAQLVADPVMVAGSGDPLLEDDAVEGLAARLFPLATIVTPNVPEAERLCDWPIEGRDTMRAAAAALHERGANAVLVKGGHLGGDEVCDVLLAEDSFHEFREPRVDSPHTHGTGCALAAAIAALLARGTPLVEAVTRARAWVRRGIERATVLGGGCNPIDHMHGEP